VLADIGQQQLNFQGVIFDRGRELLHGHCGKGSSPALFICSAKSENRCAAREDTRCRIIGELHSDDEDEDADEICCWTTCYRIRSSLPVTLYIRSQSAPGPPRLVGHSLVDQAPAPSSARSSAATFLSSCEKVQTEVCW
jgi:hypothetical protein